MKKLLGICLVLGLAIGVASVASAEGATLKNIAYGTAALAITGDSITATNTDGANVVKYALPSIAVADSVANISRGGVYNDVSVNAVAGDSVAFSIKWTLTSVDTNANIVLKKVLGAGLTLGSAAVLDGWTRTSDTVADYTKLDQPTGTSVTSVLEAKVNAP